MKNIITKTIIKIAILLLLVACSTAKYVPKGKFLLQNVKIKVDDNRVSKSEVSAYLKQKRNSRTFGLVPLYLWIYNMSGADSTKKVNQFLRNLGEAPVVYDSIQTQRTLVQLKRFMENKGFFNATVSKKEIFGSRKVKVEYRITAGQPKIVEHFFFEKSQLNEKVIGWRNMKIELADSSALRKILVATQQKKMLKEGDLLDIDKLKAERERLEEIFKEQGYYNFDKDNIHFYLDTTKKDNKVLLYCGLRTQDTLRLRQYKIKKVVVHLNLDARDRKKFNGVQNTQYNSLSILHKGKLPYKPSVLAKAIFVREGQLFNPKNVEETKSRLAVLQQFRYTNITFKEVPSTGEFGELECYVQLVSQKRQSYGTELTATYNSGNFGLATSLNYQHKNLFRGAELLNTEFSYAFERMQGLDVGTIFGAKEFGAVINLSTPKFFLPFLKAKNWRAKVPRTKVSLLSNYAERPEYKRTITDFTFSYQWKASRYFSHILTPIDLGFLRVDADERFLKNLNSYYRKTSYVDHIIPSLRYSFVYNNQGETRKTTYQRVRFSVESSGNLLNAIDRTFKSKKQGVDTTNKGYYSYFGIRYAQFLRSDIDLTYNQFVNRNHAVIYHFFAGVGYPYRNSTVMPFEKMYFMGGANSMRAWQPRSLGPGASRENAPSQRMSYGEMKLEGNIEYRFTFGKNLEGALFVDAGNVWNISKTGDRDADGKFIWNNFYKQIAVGSGVGLRYNISNNIILRLDAGMKVIDPYLEGNTLVKSYNLKDVTLNFGIGYPF